MEWNEVVITLVVLAVPICVVNFIFVIHVYHRGPLSKLQNALLLSLGCSDFCAGFFAIPCVVLCNLVPPETNDCGICIASYMFNKFVGILSFVHLTAVILERYMKIAHPFWFQNMEYTLLRSHRIVFVLWFTSLLIASTPLTWWPLATPCEGSTTLGRNLKYFDYACLAFFITLFVFIIYAFVRIFLVVRVHLHEINLTAIQLQSSTDNVLSQSFASSHSSPSTNNSLDKPQRENTRSFQRESGFSRVSLQSSRRQILLKEARIVTRFAAMVLTFVLVWGPYSYVSALDHDDQKDVSVVVKKIVAVSRFMNPLIDPWVLTVNKNHLRKLHRLLFSCGCPAFSSRSQ